MTGAVMTLAGAGGGASSGVTLPGAMAWSNIYGILYGSTNTLTFTLITVAISITAGLSSTGVLYYTKNGAAPVAYTGAFNVVVGDTLSWAVQGSGVAGVVTVTNATRASVMSTFNYTVNAFSYP